MRSTEFRSRFVLYVLLLTYISNQWCRYLLNYLYAVPGSAAPHGEAEAFASLRASVGLTDEQYGVLAGYAFSVCYVGAGLLMGRAADTRNRRNIIVLGMVLWNGATVAVKVAGGVCKWLESWRAEVAALTELRHPNVVEFLGCVVEPPTHCLVLQFCEGGDLYEALRRPTPPGLALKVGRGVAAGMLYLCPPAAAASATAGDAPTNRSVAS